jgi:D-alanyl-D-alanine carboxypeptidase
MTARRFRALLVGVALQLAIGAVVAPGPVLAASRLPACRYTDVAASDAMYSQWRQTLVDTIYRVPSSYAPHDLRSTSTAGLNSGFSVRQLVIDDLRAMSSAAHRAGAAFAIQSGYRSYATQRAVYAHWVHLVGETEARKVSARPGHSEHQLGTTMDVRSAYSTTPPWDYRDFATTTAGRWLAANAWKYGFVMSYPRGKTRVTCYSYEPWHYRYFGRPRAKLIHDSRLTSREWLWRKGGY